ncbi:sperm protein associated with the nucleus on the X chromosome N2 [Pan paniscus]|nr:sperm protein associated with the nucleus on the X chromosome N2 [Pan paniscus]
MEQPTSSTNGEKRKSPCESNNENDEMQETPNRDLAPEPSLKKMKTSEYSTVLAFCYRKAKKIHSNQLENDQSRENSINPVQEEEDEGLDSAEGSSKQDEDLDPPEGSSQEDKDIELPEGSSQEDEDLEKKRSSRSRNEIEISEITEILQGRSQINKYSDFIFLLLQ